MKVLTIGGATQDIFIEHKGSEFMTLSTNKIQAQYTLFESGEKIEVEKILYYTGGGSTNSAVSFKRLGFQVSCFCQIGEDIAGEAILKDLEQESVNIKNIVTSPQHSSGTSFIINSKYGERTIFAYRGANGFLTPDQIPFDQIKNNDFIYITSLSHSSAQLLPEIVSFAKKHKIGVAINPGISQLTKGTLTLKNSLKYIDTFILNSTEAKQFMIALVETDENYKKLLESSRKQTDESQRCTEEEACLLKGPILYENINFSIYKFFKEVLKMGPKTVVITNGSHGVYVATEKEIIFHPSIKTNVIDTVGAGDSFGSCFVACLALEHKVEDALRFGAINSSSVISRIGAKPGLLTLEKIKEKADKLDTKLLQKFTLY